MSQSTFCIYSCWMAVQSRL